MAVSVERLKLPIEAAEAILVHLGVKDLVRYKSVCRSWLALINTPTFIEKHLLVRKSKRETTIIATTNHTFDEDGFLEIYSLSPDGREPQICAQPSSHRNVGVVGSCNGLLCLLSEPDRQLLYVWNPSTRERPRTCYIADTYVKSIGFGYDETTGDYKVVKVSSWEEKDYVEIWSMRTHGWRRIQEEDSSIHECWRNVHSSFPCHVHGYNIDSCLFLGRNLYWLVWRPYFPGDDINLVSFDMGDETFRLIGIPYAIPHMFHSEITLVNFTGSLALCIYVGARRKSNLFDIWVLGDDNKWNRQFRIGPFRLGWAFPTGVCIDGNFLLQFANKYILHDPCTKQETEIWAPPFYNRHLDEYYIDSSCWSLAESLVRVTL